MYKPFTESKPGIFKNECINIYPNFDRFNYERTNLSDSVRFQYDIAQESNNSSTSNLKITESKAETSKVKFQRKKNNFTNSPGLDIGLIVDEMNKKVDINFAGSWQINKNEINKIWEFLSNYIRECLINEKSIYVPNLGTFRVYNNDNSCFNSKDRIHAIFIVELAFAKLHKLNYVSVIGNNRNCSPCMNINYSELSKISQYPRDIVQHIIEQSILAINNKIHDCKQTIIIHFPTLGTMSIKNELSRNILKYHRSQNRSINFEFSQDLF